MGKLFVCKKVGKSGKPYTALYFNNGERNIILTMENGVILEVADLRPSELTLLPTDKELVIGNVVKEK